MLIIYTISTKFEFLTGESFREHMEEFHYLDMIEISKTNKCIWKIWRVMQRKWIQWVYDEVKAMEVSPFFWYVPPKSSDETFSLEHLLRIIVQVIETEQGWFLVVLSYLRKFHWVFINTLFRTEQHYILGILICQDESNFSASCIIPFSSTMITAAGLTQTIRRRVDDSDCSFLW